MFGSRWHSYNDVFAAGREIVCHGQYELCPLRDKHSNSQPRMCIDENNAV